MNYKLLSRIKNPGFEGGGGGEMRKKKKKTPRTVMIFCNTVRHNVIIATEIVATDRTFLASAFVSDEMNGRGQRGEVDTSAVLDFNGESAFRTK